MRTVSPVQFDRVPRTGHFAHYARKSWTIVEPVVVVICLLLFSEGLLSRLFASPENPEGGAFLRTMWLPVYGFTAIMLLTRWRKLWKITVGAPFLVLLLGATLASTLWSIDPGVTFRRSIAILFTSSFGFYLAIRFRWRDILRMMGYAWLILAVGSFVSVAVSPTFGISQELHPGAWQGLWWEKNQLGGHMTRAAFLFIFLLGVDHERRKLWGAALFLTSALVLLSTSKTSLLGLLFSFGFLAFVVLSLKGPLTTMSMIWSGMIAVLGLSFALVIAPEALFGIIGKDPSLTGRTDIWDALLRAVVAKPNLGYGYGAFWLDETGPAYAVRQATEWDVPTAHNGLFELALSLGLVGVILFVLDFLMTAARAVFQSLHRPSGVYALGYVCLFVLFSVSESIVLQQNGITWMVYSLIAAKLVLDTNARRPSAVPSTETRSPSQALASGRRPQLRGRQTAARP